IEQMLATMRKSIPHSDLSGKGFANDIQTTMLDQAIAQAVGKQGRMGIASSLYRQLSVQQQSSTNALAMQPGIKGIPQTTDSTLSGRLQITESADKQGELHGTD
ncbi:MAG: rod-binding protein, partial [Mariprofundaceae bacterium]|nr:rod-binding protein [Mariprofundaceae bacterium]